MDPLYEQRQDCFFSLDVGLYGLDGNLGLVAQLRRCCGCWLWCFLLSRDCHRALFRGGTLHVLIEGAVELDYPAVLNRPERGGEVGDQAAVVRDKEDAAGIG